MNYIESIFEVLKGGGKRSIRNSISGETILQELRRHSRIPGWDYNSKIYMHPYVHSSTGNTIAKSWKQPKCPSTDEWIKKMWYIYTMEYYSAIKKEWNNAICSNMDGTRDYHTKWSKSERERQIPYDITYVWNLKYGTNEPIYKTETDS